MKKLVIAGELLLAATLSGSSASLAQSNYYGGPYYGTGGDYYPPVYGTPGVGVYDYYAPGYSVPAVPGLSYGYGSGYGYGYGGDPYDYDRVDQPGRGNSAESQR